MYCRWFLLMRLRWTHRQRSQCLLEWPLSSAWLCRVHPSLPSSGHLFASLQLLSNESVACVWPSDPPRSVVAFKPRQGSKCEASSVNWSTGNGLALLAMNWLCCESDDFISMDHWTVFGFYQFIVALFSVVCWCFLVNTFIVWSVFTIFGITVFAQIKNTVENNKNVEQIC